MQITIFGGSGFIGKKLSEELIMRGHSVTCVSRSGKPIDLTTAWAQKVHWLRSDILTDKNWHPAAKEADWIIDAIGILKEIPSKNITYERFILKPVQIILTYLDTQENPAKFLFLSANSAPFPLRKYMDAKLQAEQSIKAQTEQNVIFYPSLVMDKKRYSSIIGGQLIQGFKKIPGLRKLVKGYDPLSREQLAIEIANVIEGQSSRFTKRRT
ncbi:NAD-dependent epimerase/dehydratase family protein [Enterococcus sp. AZ126]|uniref:NAD-dependent epimerase/dehydratase family protein n=1 Tax=Enterococcus sp. AZ126 TaxID=2774635 RepID=UPI003F21059B